MSLSDGDPADDGDIWFRIATQQGHIVKGRVHHSAFGGTAIAPPNPAKNRPWARELSGRLRSHAGTLEEITQHADKYCADLTANAPSQGQKVFSGVAYIRVRDAKVSFENALTGGVHFTPLGTDPAHADFTFDRWIGSAREERERFNLWLTGILKGLHNPGQLDLLPAAEDTRTVFQQIRDFTRVHLGGTEKPKQ
jgi:hypothetical protein